MKSFYKLIVSISCLFALSSCEGEQMVKALVGLVDTGVSLQSIIKQDRCSGFYR